MLNWRLIQMPSSVSDYVILHELAHLEQPIIRARFWRVVARLCPEWQAAERWLRKHGRELMVRDRGAEAPRLRLLFARGTGARLPNSYLPKAMRCSFVTS